MARKEYSDSFDIDELQQPIKEPRKEIPIDDFVTEEIFKAGKFAGAKMTHVPTGINIFRELRRGQFIPDREMKAEIKKLIPR